MKRVPAEDLLLYKASYPGRSSSFCFQNWLHNFLSPLPPGGGTWVTFCWVLAAGLSEPLFYIMWPIIDPILVIFGQICDFQDPNLVTFYYYELTHFLD